MIKTTETEVFFVHILPWTQSLMQRHYLKKVFDGVWDSDFEWSEQVKFVKFLMLLNSWNQWINDRPLYQSLFQRLLSLVVPLFTICWKFNLFYVKQYLEEELKRTRLRQKENQRRNVKRNLSSIKMKFLQDLS